MDNIFLPARRLFLLAMVAFATCTARGAITVSLSVIETNPPTARLAIEGTVASAQYEIQRTFNLTSGNWSVIGTVTGNGGEVLFDDNTIGSASPAFYRVELPPPVPAPIPRTGWTLLYVSSQELNAGAWGPATPATNAFDGNPNTIWHTEWVNNKPPHPHELQINLGAVYSISGFRHLPRQDGILNGRIGQYEFYVSLDGVNWGDPVASGTLPDTAAETEITLPPQNGQYVRLRVLTSLYDPDVTSLAELTVLTDRAPDGTIDSPLNDVTIGAGSSANFSGSGSDPDNYTPLTYRWNFGAGSGIPDATVANPGAIQFNNTGIFTVTFTVTDSRGLVDPVPATRKIKVLGPGSTFIPHAGWTLSYVDSWESTGENAPGTNTFDDDPASYWHTQWFAASPTPPHEIQINLGTVCNVSGFNYLPRQSGSHGHIGQYEFYVSQDGANWGSPLVSGSFANTYSEQDLRFPPKTGQYIRLRALTEVNGQPWTTIAEINVLQAGTVSNQLPGGSITSPSADGTIVAGGAINFQGSASDPNGNLPLSYRWTFQPGSAVEDVTVEDPGLVHFNVPGTYVVTFTVANSLGNVVQDTRTITVLGASTLIPKTNWELLSADSQDAAHPATNAFDSNASTFWETQTVNPSLPPHEIKIDLGADYDIGGFRYRPRQDSSTGRIGQYRFYISMDGVNWGSAVAAGSFANTTQEQEVQFASTLGRYVRLQATTEVTGQPYTALAELAVLQSPALTPSVRLVQPKSYYLQPSSNLDVLSEASLMNGEGVRLVIDGGPPTGAQFDDYTSPFTVTFSGISTAPHTIDAFVIDSAGGLVSGLGTHDQAVQIGIGEYYVAMGDSITAGFGDTISSDDTSQDGRTTGGGFEPVLANLLEGVLNRPVLVYNEGIGGDKSIEGVGQIQRLLQKHHYAKRFLIMYGTNDAGTVASGLGLQPGNAGYAGSFKDNMQRIINDVNSAGKVVVLAKPPVILPVGSQRDSQLLELISVIDELVADSANKITIPPADFHAYFMNHTDQYNGPLHPNGAGYQGMAQLWSQALTQ